jgi:hypothetical protein
LPVSAFILVAFTTRFQPFSLNSLPKFAKPHNFIYFFVSSLLLLAAISL